MSLVRKARSKREFIYGGEAHITRPLDSQHLNDEQWADYLFMRTNTQGLHAERWVHAHGCGQWFNVLRDTATDEIRNSYRIGEKPALMDVDQVDAEREDLDRVDAQTRSKPMQPEMRSPRPDNLPPIGGYATTAISRRSVPASTAATWKAWQATAWPARCWPTAFTLSAAASSITARAAFSAPGPRSPTRWSRLATNRP